MSRLLAATAALATAGGVAGLWGSRRWQAETRRLRAGLEAAREAAGPERVDFGQLGDLPAPVGRYLRLALTDGQPVVRGARLTHSGHFNMSEDGEDWKPFTSDQVVVTSRPGFDWDARIRMAPGLYARVHDAYVAGRGRLHASLFGLLSLVDLEDGGELARGELMRFLAEATWYPTALLPGRGVAWHEVDERSARAVLEDGHGEEKVGVDLVFTFSADGLVDTVSSEARGRLVDGRWTATPWRGRFWNYAERHGLRVPLDGEVAWLVDGREQVYWRGHLEAVDYELSAPGP